MANGMALRLSLAVLALAVSANAKPTGGTRQIQYELAKGEASWILRGDKVVEY